MSYRRRNPAQALLLMQLLSLVYQLPVKPAVTLALAGLQVLLHLNILHEAFPILARLEGDRTCVLASEVLAHPFQAVLWLRTVLAALSHVNDTHLYYNCVSLIWKGAKLEAKYGTTTFAILVAALIPLCAIFEALLAVAANAYFGHSSWLTECGIGFSGVLYALKVLLTADATHMEHIGGLHLPARYAAWGELFFTYLMVPGTSFLGHLAGILAGVTALLAMKLLPEGGLQRLKALWTLLSTTGMDAFTAENGGQPGAPAHQPEHAYPQQRQQAQHQHPQHAYGQQGQGYGAHHARNQQEEADAAFAARLQAEENARAQRATGAGTGTQSYNAASSNASGSGGDGYAPVPGGIPPRPHALMAAGQGLNAVHHSVGSDDSGTGSTGSGGSVRVSPVEAAAEAARRRAQAAIGASALVGGRR